MKGNYLKDKQTLLTKLSPLQFNALVLRGMSESDVNDTWPTNLCNDASVIVMLSHRIPRMKLERIQRERQSVHSQSLLSDSDTVST